MAELRRAAKLTFVVPVGPYHRHLVDRAVATIEAQTERAAVVVVHDDERRGPGVTRNRGIAKVKTPLVSFLDADDRLEPDFVEKMVSAWRPAHFVHCDFHMGGSVHETGPGVLLQAPKFYHCVVTSIVSKYVLDQVGGFDETLRGIEDTDLWLRIINRGVCPIHVPLPLMHYEKDGQISKWVATDEEHLRRWREMLERNKFMGCCGKGSAALQQAVPVGTKQAGDVLVAVNWGSNREWAGKATGRRYPRSGHGKLVWVAPEDVAANPRRLTTVSMILEEDDQAGG